jgi:hypothetical protein
MATIIIKPFIRKESDSIGLSEIGLNAFPGTVSSFPVPIKNKKFLTGLDENAFYLAKLSEKEREKEITRIRKTCEEYSQKYKEFNLCNCSAEGPEKNEFYDKLSIDLFASNTYFDTSNPIDMIKLSILKHYAMYDPRSIIAINLKEATNSNKDYKYYIANEELDIEETVSKKREINKAISTWDTIASKDKTKMLLIIKYLLPANKSYNVESDNRLYKRGDDFINGIADGVKAKDGDDNYNKFMTVVKIPNEELVSKIVIKYAIYLNVIRQNRDKEYVYLKTGQTLGRNGEEVYGFLSNPKNIEIYGDIKSDVEKEIKIY